jgi:YggT family protein
MPQTYEKTTVVREDTPDVVGVQPAEPVVLVNQDDAIVVRRPTAVSVTYYILDVIEILLLLQFLFALFRANPGSPIVTLIRVLTDPLVAPFAGIFPSAAAVGTSIDWAALVGMAIYAIIAYLIVKLIYLSYRRTA